MPLLFKIVPWHSAELLSIVYVYKAVMCLMEEVHVLDMLCSGMSYSGFGYEFIVSEQVVFKWKHIKKLCFDQLMKMF